MKLALVLALILAALVAAPSLISAACNETFTGSHVYTGNCQVTTPGFLNFPTHLHLTGLFGPLAANGAHEDIVVPAGSPASAAGFRIWDPRPAPPRDGGPLGHSFALMSPDETNSVGLGWYGNYNIPTLRTSSSYFAMLLNDPQQELVIPTNAFMVNISPMPGQASLFVFVDDGPFNRGLQGLLPGANDSGGMGLRCMTVPNGP